MKSPYIFLFQIAVCVSAPADTLSNLNHFFSSSRPDYDPASIEGDVAVGDPVYAPISPADSDFGVQQVLGTYSGRAPVDVTFDTSINHTDNAPGEIPFNDDASWFSASRLALTWRPRIAYGWFADIGIAQELIRFERDKAIDFENFLPHLGVVKSIPELDDLIYFARYEYQRITVGSLADSTYSAQRIRSGFQKDLLLTARYQLSTGIDAAIDLAADSTAQERNEYSADVSYTYRFADHLSSTLSWTGSMWDFQGSKRQDWNHIVGLELTWKPHENTSIYTNFFYSNHDSNEGFGANDYEAWQSGIGLGLNYSF